MDKDIKEAFKKAKFVFGNKNILILNKDDYVYTCKYYGTFLMIYSDV